MVKTWLAAVVIAAFIPVSAWAQEGLATSSTIEGNNTIQQAPSGGRVGGAATAGQAGQNNQGLSDADEQALERRNAAASQICKGC